MAFQMVHQYTHCTPNEYLIDIFLWVICTYCQLFYQTQLKIPLETLVITLLRTSFSEADNTGSRDKCSTVPPALSNYTNSLQTSGPKFTVKFVALFLQTHGSRPPKLGRLFILVLKIIHICEFELNLFSKLFKNV